MFLASWLNILAQGTKNEDIEEAHNTTCSADQTAGKGSKVQSHAENLTSEIHLAICHQNADEVPECGRLSRNQHTQTPKC